MQQTLMKAVVPKTIAMRFFSVQHTCDVIMKASPKQSIFIVCKTPEDALKLVAGGVPVKEINVGNIHHGPGKEEVSKYIALGLMTRRLCGNCGINTAWYLTQEQPLPGTTVPRRWI